MTPLEVFHAKMAAIPPEPPYPYWFWKITLGLWLAITPGILPF
jgi:hypothetical protein